MTSLKNMTPSQQPYQQLNAGIEGVYGGQEKQMKLLVEALQAVQGKGRIPYTELRELVGDVGAFLARPTTLPGAGETLVVLLKKVIPKHFRTRYKEKMRDQGRPQTGNTFIRYMKHALNDEIDEAETTRKDNKEKEIDKKPVKTLGKLYFNRHSSEEEIGQDSEPSSSEEGQVRLTKEPNQELPNCICCSEGKHRIHNCRKFFLVFNLRERTQFAKNERLCFKCLRVDHAMAQCPFRAKPECRFCSSKSHHYLLCQGTTEAVSGVTRGAEEVEVETEVGMGLEGIGEVIAKKSISTMQLVAHIEAVNGQLIPINALTDTGSSHNIIDRESSPESWLNGISVQIPGHGTRRAHYGARCRVWGTNPGQPQKPAGKTQNTVLRLR